MIDIDSLPKIRGTYRVGYDLSKTTWFRVGGKADVLFKPLNTEDLAYFLKNKPENVPVYVIGVGSNLLVRDGGIRGVVIKLGSNFTTITHNEQFLIAGAGALDFNVSYYAMINEIGGAEFFSGIPGTIGGALRMNAGAYGGEVSQILVKAQAVNLKGEILGFKNKDFDFKYRSTSLPNDIIFTRAWFENTYDSKQNIKAKIDDIFKKRNESQPIKARTGGSTFKNPDNYKAWELIDKVGMRGYRIGGACFSEKHCNFIINDKNATAKDIEDLAELAKMRVLEKFGITLEWEIKVVGEKINE